MRLYLVEYIEAGENDHQFIWCGTKADVAKQKRLIKKDPAQRLFTIDEVDVPTDKQGLLSWLNHLTIKG